MDYLEWNRHSYEDFEKTLVELACVSIAFLIGLGVGVLRIVLLFPLFSFLIAVLFVFCL